MKAGVALNPHTNVNVLEDTIKDIDLVLIMSVNPGFGGQSFIENTYNKIAQLRELMKRKDTSAFIEIDGGVTNTNAKQLVEIGADVLVAGNYIFSSANPLETVKALKSLANA
jgi:ribulose-phosphate 3-epimerase